MQRGQDSVLNPRLASLPACGSGHSFPDTQFNSAAANGEMWVICEGRSVPRPWGKLPAQARGGGSSRCSGGEGSPGLARAPQGSLLIIRRHPQGLLGGRAGGEQGCSVHSGIFKELGPWDTRVHDRVFLLK